MKNQEFKADFIKGKQGGIEVVPICPVCKNKGEIGTSSVDILSINVNRLKAKIRVLCLNCKTAFNVTVEVSNMELESPLE